MWTFIDLYRDILTEIKVNGVNVENSGTVSHSDGLFKFQCPTCTLQYMFLMIGVKLAIFFFFSIPIFCRSYLPFEKISSSTSLSYIE